MPWDLKEAVGIVVGLTGLAASAVATIRYFVKKEQIEGDLKRLQERYDELDTRHREILQAMGTIKLSGTAALLLKSEIETQLKLVMTALQAKASSVLVPLPGKTPTDLVFLAVLGPAAASIQRTTVPINKGISGFVFAHGQPYLALDVRNDKKFFQGVDRLSSYTTEDILSVPVIHGGVTVGVLQILNKTEGAFTQQDLQIAQRSADLLASNVAQFLADPNNFELLGFAPAERMREGTVLICDLTASSLLLDTLNFASAMSLMNAYLERSTDIVMHAGGTVDKYIGDGAMFRFNVPHEIPDSRRQALRAAVQMRDGFQKQKDAWTAAGIPVTPLFTRLGIATGPL